MGFSRHFPVFQEYWSELPFPSPEDIPDSGIKPVSPALAGGFFTTEPPWEPLINIESESEVAQSCPTVCDPMDCSY